MMRDNPVVSTKITMHACDSQLVGKISKYCIYYTTVLQLLKEKEWISDCVSNERWDGKSPGNVKARHETRKTQKTELWMGRRYVGYGSILALP